MTREEREVAIKVIRNFPVESTGERKAVLTAIKALEQEPCPNAINRSDMLDAVGHGATYTSEKLQIIIKGLPPVTPQPKTGKWIYKKDLKQFFCNKCEYPSLTDDDKYIYSMDLPNFCENCGAKMVDPQESEE